MKDRGPLRLRETDVPLPVIFEGRDGQVAVYELKPASRKFGLSLQAASDWTKRLLLRRR